MVLGNNTDECASEAPTQPPQSSTFDVTFSFAAGGWFQMFHFGACQALVDSGYLRQLEAEGKQVRFCGSSAGALAAAALASDCTTMFPDMRDFALECADHYRESWWNFLCMKEYLVASIHRFGDKIVESRGMADVINAVNGGRLEVYATTLPYLRRKCIDAFGDFQDVEEALLASCCLTPVVGFPFQLRNGGEWVCDGGMTAFQPRGGHGENKDGGRLITISPFYFTTADIRPTIFVPAWWGLYPPKRSWHHALFDVGYNSTLDHLLKHQLVAPATLGDLFKPTTELEAAFQGGPTQGGILAMSRDMLVTLVYLVVCRPLAILLIYAEMLLMSIVHAVSSTLTSNKRWTSLYGNLRNLVSLRVFLRLLFSRRIPINEARLAQSSSLYRAFQPLVFEGNKIRRGGGIAAAGGGGDSAKRKRFIVETHCNMTTGAYREKSTAASTSGSLLDRIAGAGQSTPPRPKAVNSI